MQSRAAVRRPAAAYIQERGVCCAAFVMKCSQVGALRRWATSPPTARRPDAKSRMGTDRKSASPGTDGDRDNQIPVWAGQKDHWRPCQATRRAMRTFPRLHERQHSLRWPENTTYHPCLYSSGRSNDVLGFGYCYGELPSGQLVGIVAETEIAAGGARKKVCVTYTTAN